MVDFRQRREFRTEEPVLQVDAGLPVGSYVFRLEVEDENGNRSRAAKVELNIVGGRNAVRPRVVNPVTGPAVITPRPRNS